MNSNVNYFAGQSNQNTAEMTKARSFRRLKATCSLAHSDRITILRGQLTLLRERALRGIPISVDSLARTEGLVRSLELTELSA